MPEIPVPLVNYVGLIRKRKSPYYEIAEYLAKEMEMRYHTFGRGSETTYTINPRILQEEIEKTVRDEKLTTINTCRTILAMLHGAKLEDEKDFFVTTTSSGRRNYHIKVNDRTMNSISSLF